MVLIPPLPTPTLSKKVTCSYHRWFSSHHSLLPHCPQSHVSIPPMVLIQPLLTPTLSKKVTCSYHRWVSSHHPLLPHCPQSHVSITPMVLIQPLLTPTLSTKSLVHNTNGSHQTSPDSHSVHKVTCPDHRWFSSYHSLLPHCPQSHIPRPPMVLIPPSRLPHYQQREDGLSFKKASASLDSFVYYFARRKD